MSLTCEDTKIMLMPFACPRCKKDHWLISYHSDEKYHNIECVNCGYEKILEEIFSKRRLRRVTKEAKFKTEE